MKALSDLRHDPYGIKAVFHAVMGVVILFAGSLLASLPVDLFYAITKSEASGIVIIIRPVLEITVLSLFVCLYIRKVLKLPLQDFRICKPQNILVWCVCAFVLPLAVSAFYIFFIPGAFSSSDLDATRKIAVIVRAIFRTCLLAGITEELVFRGLIMHVLEIRWGKPIAVIIPSLLFGLLHILNMDSPSIADILFLIVAGTAVGIMFSLIAVQSNSIWASAAVHGIWNLLIIGGILEISAGPSSAIFSYEVTSKSNLLTGGAFGIEASLPAVAGYGIVILLALFLMRRNPNKKAGSF